ncbi:nucleotidyltransferase domain-containing protein [Micromonospora sp. NPDC004704]
MDESEEERIQSLYGRWAPLSPAEVATLLDGSGVRWWVVGGRAARVGAPARRHSDTDVALRRSDLPRLRDHLADWHLWQAHEGGLHPLLPGTDLPADREQLWLRRNADHPWVADLLLQAGDEEWIFKKDNRVRLPWSRALHRVDGVPHLRPEVALLHKAHLDRPKDRADLAAAMLAPDARAWLGTTLDLLGHAEWAHLARTGATASDSD